MSEMIERVAKALEVVIWEYKDSSVAFQSHQLARAAIEAMREPTDEMIEAADETGEGGGVSDTGCIEPTIYDLGIVWQTMIDVALSEKP